MSSHHSVQTVQNIHCGDFQKWQVRCVQIPVGCTSALQVCVLHHTVVLCQHVRYFINKMYLEFG